MAVAGSCAYLGGTTPNETVRESMQPYTWKHPIRGIPRNSTMFEHPNRKRVHGKCLSRQLPVQFPPRKEVRAAVWCPYVTLLQMQKTCHSDHPNVLGHVAAPMHLFLK